jgi:membrane associated rhomboid family serine protease
MQQPTYRPPTQFAVFPPVIKNLLILNGLLFLAQQVAAATLSNSSLLASFLTLMALYPPGAEGGITIFGDISRLVSFWPWQLVTYAFLHGGFGHLLFNMFALWMFGVQIENQWGSNRFAIFYFVCVVGAALTHLLFMTRPIPTIGASGGVFGVLLAFGMMFPNRPIYLYFLFPIKAKWLVIGLGALELYSAISGTQAGVANIAHLGGMLFGFLLIQYWRGKLPVKPQRAMRW